MNPSATILVGNEYEATHPRALAIYCSDGRFTQAVEELLAHRGHPRLDTLTLPGGPGLLNAWSARFSEHDAVSRAADFLVQGHALSHIFLIAHLGCGYYRAKFPYASAEHIEGEQLADLRMAARELHKKDRRVTVEAYLARPVGRSIHFESVPLV